MGAHESGCFLQMAYCAKKVAAFGKFRDKDINSADA